MTVAERDRPALAPDDGKLPLLRVPAVRLEDLTRRAIIQRKALALVKIVTDDPRRIFSEKA